MSSDTTVFHSQIPGVELTGRGKVRDLYDLGESLLFVATDRLSAFDVVFPTPISGKGRVLTQMTLFWLEQLSGIVDNHLITADIEEILRAIQSAGATDLQSSRQMLEGRSMLVQKTRPFPVECVVRGYIAGSLWKEYQDAGGHATIHGHVLPAGLRESDRLPEPVFTPATKAESGHDENISSVEAAQIVGEDVICRLEELSLQIYDRASKIASERGMILADTKFEFGAINSEIILIDEALTPDSSRFWDAGTYEPGRPQEAFDKQYVRDWVLKQGWNRQPPAPALPQEVVEGTTRRYQEAYRRLSGRDIE